MSLCETKISPPDLSKIENEDLAKIHAISMKINLFHQNFIRSQEANLFSVIPQALLLPDLLHEDPVDLHADLARHLDG